MRHGRGKGKRTAVQYLPGRVGNLPVKPKPSQDKLRAMETESRQNQKVAPVQTAKVRVSARRTWRLNETLTKGKREHAANSSCSCSMLGLVWLGLVRIGQGRSGSVRIGYVDDAASSGASFPAAVSNQVLEPVSKAEFEPKVHRADRSHSRQEPQQTGATADRSQFSSQSSSQRFTEQTGALPSECRLARGTERPCQAPDALQGVLRPCQAPTLPDRLHGHAVSLPWRGRPQPQLAIGLKDLLREHMHTQARPSMHAPPLFHAASDAHAC
eukprot:11480-Chlamydomonas_euryale.AAC.4